MVGLGRRSSLALVQLLGWLLLGTLEQALSEPTNGRNMGPRHQALGSGLPLPGLAPRRPSPSAPTPFANAVFGPMMGIIRLYFAEGVVCR